MDEHIQSGSSEALSHGSVAVSDQTCNECKRRKGKCDRLLPECSPCARNRRHCLYEKHSRTPLTRKHLTEVEERLKRAELRARVAEQRASLAEERIGRVTTLDSAANGIAVNKDHEETRSLHIQNDEQAISSVQQTSDIGLENHNITLDQPSSDHFGVVDIDSTWSDALDALHDSTSVEDPITQAHVLQNEIDFQNDQTAIQHGVHYSTNLSSYQASETSREATPGMPEGPPSENDDFSWDENSTNLLVKEPGRTAPSYDDMEPDVMDGMASLSVEDHGAGYLGSSSGAAMLRLLLPDADHRKPSQLSRSVAQNKELTLQATGWIPTPLWEQLRLSEVDLDSAIDAYFSLYHLSYPIVHEPTFRAQYAQVIPRPNGTSWNALAYMIGALGVFTTTTDVQNNDDMRLFNAAKSNISIDILERGNITLVQVLVLMSNYLQKRNKPNSGYNYLGLALHTAMGLGLHKEFRNWKIAPLTMEIRRRVWWSLHNFYIGALITFGRPLSWPETGVEVAMPLNLYDRASRATKCSASVKPC